MSAPVQAQQIADPVFQIQDNFRRPNERDIFVLPNYPEWEALGIRAGAVTLRPTIDVGARYNSNLLAQANKGGSDIGIDVAPRLDIGDNSERYDLKAYVGGNLVRYSDHPREGIETLESGLTLDLPIGPATEIRVRADGGILQEDRGATFAPVNSRTPIRYRQFVGSLGVVHAPGRLVIAPTVEFQRLNYDNNVLRSDNSVVLDQDGRDIKRVSGALTLGYALSPTTVFYVGGELNKRNYDRTPTGTIPGEADRDSDGYAYYVGARIQPSALTRLDVAVGYQRQDFAPPLDDPKGLYLRAQFDWTPLRQLVVTASARRDISESGALLAGGVVRTTVQGGVDYEIRRNLHVSADVEYGHYRTASLDRSDDRVRSNVDVRYLAGRNIEWFAQAAVLISRSDAVNIADFDRTQVLTGVRFKL